MVISLDKKLPCNPCNGVGSASGSNLQTAWWIVAPFQWGQVLWFAEYVQKLYIYDTTDIHFLQMTLQTRGIENYHQCSFWRYKESNYERSPDREKPDLRRSNGRFPPLNLDVHRGHWWALRLSVSCVTTAQCKCVSKGVTNVYFNNFLQRRLYTSSMLIKQMLSTRAVEQRTTCVQISWPTQRNNCWVPCSKIF